MNSVREKILAAECHGKVSAARFAGKSLPYIDNLVNLLIVGEGFEVPDVELRRVLAPYGAMAVGGKMTVKMLREFKGTANTQVFVLHEGRLPPATSSCRTARTAWRRPTASCSSSTRTVGSSAGERSK